MEAFIWPAIGLVIGGGVGLLVFAVLRRGQGNAIALAQRDSEARFASFVEEVRAKFEESSRTALSDNSEQFLMLANTALKEQTTRGDQTLEEKKKLIDAQLSQVAQKLTDLNGVIQAIEKQRAEAYGSLCTEVQRNQQATNRLQETTARLREALANPQSRGQWGERMADDVLRLAGLVEGVNYHRQQRTEGNDRPDFTFSLPGGRVVHMDVKFPAGNYLRMLDSADAPSREAHAEQFRKDVRKHVTDVSRRNYVDPAAGTVDYVLVFIPNEQIYGFMHAQDPQLFEESLGRKVVLCSPWTLYAMLAVIRQSVENFRLEHSARQILDLLAEFRKQWEKYVEAMEKMGRKLDDAVKEYHDLTGVRTRQLDRQLDRVEDLRAMQQPGTNGTSEGRPAVTKELPL